MSLLQDSPHARTSVGTVCCRGRTFTDSCVGGSGGSFSEVRGSSYLANGTIGDRRSTSRGRACEDVSGRNAKRLSSRNSKRSKYPDWFKKRNSPGFQVGNPSYFGGRHSQRIGTQSTGTRAFGADGASRANSGEAIRRTVKHKEGVFRYAMGRARAGITDGSTRSREFIAGNVT